VENETAGSDIQVRAVAYDDRNTVRDAGSRAQDQCPLANYCCARVSVGAAKGQGPETGLGQTAGTVVPDRAREEDVVSGGIDRAAPCIESYRAHRNIRRVP